VYISDLPNYYVHTTGTYYFAGMYTAILPMIPGIYAIYKLLKEDPRERQSSFKRMKASAMPLKKVALSAPTTQARRTQ